MIKILLQGQKISLLDIIALLFIFTPAYLTYNYPIFLQLNTIVHTILAIVSIVILVREDLKIPKIFYLILGVFIIRYISTYFYTPSLSDFYGRSVFRSMGALSYIIARILSRDAKTFFDSATVFFIANVIINIATIILYPNGLYANEDSAYSENFWLGYDNMHVRFQIPAMMMACATDVIRKGKIKKFTWIIIGIIVFSNVIRQCSTSIVTLAISLCLLLFFDKFQQKKIFRVLYSPITSFVVLVVGTIIVVSFSLGTMDVPILSDITNFFDKDTSLTGRDYIWANTLLQLQYQPFLGYGYQNPETVSETLAHGAGFGFSPHNLLLEILYYGGIIMALWVLFIYIHLAIIYRANKSRYLCIISATWLFTISIMGLTEPQFQNYLFFAWVMCAMLPMISNNYSNENKLS